MNNRERREELLNHSIYGTPCEPLTQEEMEMGWHFCEDWDEMFITPDDPEWECCTCNKEGLAI